MSYCTEDDLLRMIPEEDLTELTAETGTVPDSAVIADAIGKAAAEIDAYLGVKYVVPVSPIPEQVKALSVDLAIYHLYSRHSIMPPVRQQKYDAGLAFLKDVAAGQAVIIGAGGEVPTAAREVADITSAVRCFRRDNLRDW